MRDRHTIRFLTVQVRWLTIRKREGRRRPAPTGSRHFDFHSLEALCIRLLCLLLLLLTLLKLLVAALPKVRLKLLL